MSPRTFNIIQSLTYLLVMAVLCAKIKRPYTAVDDTFTNHFAKAEAKYKDEVKDVISYMDWHMHEPGNLEKVTPYYNMILHTDSLTNQIITFLNYASDKPMLLDIVQVRIDEYCMATLGQVEYDSAALRPFIDEAIKGNNIIKDRSTKWVYSILHGQPDEKRALVFELLKSNVLAVESIVIKRLRQVGTLAWCGYDTTTVITMPPFQFSNTADHIHCNIALVHFNPHTRIEAYYSGRKLETVNAVSFFTDTATAPGDYEVHGFLRWARYAYNSWDTLLWSFQYRVITKGASLQLANQVCYRNVPNPISVAIPGYAADHIRLWAKGATVSNNPDGTMAVIVMDKHRDKIIVYADATDARGHTSTVHAAEFAVRDLPAPTLTVDGKVISSISPDTHLLSAKSADEDWPANYIITSYAACIISAEGHFVGDYTVSGNSIGASSKELQDVIPHLTTGARIYLSNIKAKTNMGNTVSVAPSGLVIQ